MAKQIRKLTQVDRIDLYLFMVDKLDKNETYVVYRTREDGTSWTDILIAQEFSAQGGKEVSEDTVRYLRTKRWGTIRPTPVRPALKPDLISTQAIADLHIETKELRALLTNHHNNLIAIARRLNELPAAVSPTDLAAEKARINRLYSDLDLTDRRLQELQKEQDKRALKVEQQATLAREQTAMIDKICLHLKARYGFDVRAAA